MKILKEKLKKEGIKFFKFTYNSEIILVVDDELDEEEVLKIWQFIKEKEDMK